MKLVEEATMSGKQRLLKAELEQKVEQIQKERDKYKKRLGKYKEKALGEKRPKWKLALIIVGVALGVGFGCYYWGNAVGYDTGYSWGFSVGNQEGYSEGHDVGHDEGYNVGWPEGYDVGFDEGYYQGDQAGYKSGYSEGEQVGYYNGLDDGWMDGYSEGSVEGYDEGRKDGYASGLGVSRVLSQHEVRTLGQQHVPVSTVEKPALKNPHWDDSELYEKLKEINWANYMDSVYMVTEYDCNDLSVTVWNRLHNEAITSVIVLGNLDIDGATWSETNHCWLIVLSQTKLYAVECTNGSVYPYKGHEQYFAGFFYLKPSELRDDLGYRW